MIRFCLWCALLFLAALAINMTEAGELELMAMRGDAGDGKTQVNEFQSPWRPVGDTEEVMAARVFDLSEMAGGNSYMEWKNNCVFLPSPLAGAPLELRDEAGFGRVTPYVDKPVVGAGFLELLVDELVGDP